MCTLLILRDGDEVVATMNRDDEFSRIEGDVKNFLTNVTAPIDVRSQGSWVALNKNNVAAFLLNSYEDYQPKNLKSRGEIVLRALANGDLDQCLNFVRNDFDFKNFRPFHLHLLKGFSLFKFSFDGNDLTEQEIIIDDYYVTTSSSIKEKEVKEFRFLMFEKWQQQGRKLIDKIPQFNLLQNKGQEDYAVMVKRPKVGTLSISQIFMKNNQSILRYLPQKQFKDFVINEL